MTAVRNPFRLQRAESIDSDTDFVRLFGPGVLALLDPETLWTQPHFIRSAPGGGKTTLLKLFTPSVLQTLFAQHAAADYRDLFTRVKELGALDDQGLRVVGVMLPCGKTFPEIADLGLPEARATRLLLALLDARMLLGALRSLLAVHRLRYPEDLPRVQLAAASDIDPRTSPPLPCDGEAARRWAEARERAVCDLIDGIGGHDALGHDELLTLRLLDRSLVSVAGHPPPARWLVMLDDAHKLTGLQREALRARVIEQRSRTSVWVAERTEALSLDEKTAPGALEGRDAIVVNVEAAWRDHRWRFEQTMTNIAELRTRMANEAATAGSPVPSFTTSLACSLDGPEWTEPMEQCLRIVRERVERFVSRQPAYAPWAANLSATGTPREQALAWRGLEIVIARHQRKRQSTFDFAVATDQADRHDDSDVKAAAELFLAKEFDLPYYAGAPVVAALGSGNVEQYLRIAGDLFEEVLAAALLRRRAPSIEPRRQEKVLAAACEARLADVPRRAADGRAVVAFLEAVGQFCEEVTYQPNAPYAPGVNGVAISMQERELLLDPARMPTAQHRRFAQVLSAALAQNLLRAEVDKPSKGQRVIVFYLNRLLCVRHHLPLHYGGFRERPLRTLIEWMERGYASPRARELPL